MVGDIFGTQKAMTQLLKTAVVSKFGLPLKEEFLVFQAVNKLSDYMKICMILLEAK
jgi:hypothetical protein